MKVLLRLALATKTQTRQALRKSNFYSPGPGHSPCHPHERSHGRTSDLVFTTEPTLSVKLPVLKKGNGGGVGGRPILIPILH